MKKFVYNKDSITIANIDLEAVIVEQLHSFEDKLVRKLTT